MKLLLIILAVMTWTVQDKNTVSGQGTCPCGTEVEYHCTYQKGTVRAGDEATLKLTNLGRITLESVTMSLKANKNSGAGIVSVSSNITSQPITTDVTFENVGEQVQVFSGCLDPVSELEIAITGTENSLYVESYTITYYQYPHTVTLLSGNEKYGILKEETAGAGVLLPSLPDQGTWKFVGWSEIEFGQIEETPTIIPAGTQFYLSDDATLWAVYRHHKPAQDTCVTYLQSGKYVYFNTVNNIAISSYPQNGRMKSVPVCTTDEQQHYLITFNSSCDSATIQHVPTGIYVGYKKEKLNTSESWWAVFHQGDKTAFYMTYNEKTYILWPNIQDGYESIYAGLLNPKDITVTPTALMPAREIETPVFTCHPEYQLPIQNVHAPAREYVVPFGNYELHILNGQKHLQLR